MDRITGHGAHSSGETNRPWIGRTAKALLLLTLSLVAPQLARADATTPQGRVIGGTVATQADVSSSGRWSAVVAIFATDAQGTRLCTGTLVATNWVATAAHCVADEQNASITLAPDDVFVAPGITTTQSAGDVLVPAVSTHVHPGFSWVNASWDVALIELETTIPSTPVALPDPLRPNTYSVGNADNVAGFGRSQATNSGSSGTLRSGRIEQVSAPACETYNPGSGEYSDCYLPGPTRQATCFGDSGGPLVRYDSTQGNVPVLWGITSTGPDPCDAATSGQFAPSYETRVTAVVDWLRATMSGTTYVPKSPATNRTTGSTSNSTAPKGSGGSITGGGTRAPAGGTGIGIFQTTLAAKPSLNRGTSLTLSSSFVGSTGTGKAEIVRCVRTKCKTTARATITYAAAGTTVATKFTVPKCAKRATITLRLKVYDGTGTLKDEANQRLARCS
jgi:secreted trypsin-like serine protease